METIVKYAQELVYSLVCLMPSSYQKASLNALMGRFLEAQGHPLPQHTQEKSASAKKPISQPLSMVYPCCDSYNAQNNIAATRERIVRAKILHFRC